MKIALIAPPFITVPPQQYGGTELFIAQLAEGLRAKGIDVVVYTNGESTVDVEKRWLFEKGQWPIKGDIYNHVRDATHTAWSLHGAAAEADLIHINNATGVTFSQFIGQPMVCTLHHPFEPGLTELYRHFHGVHYVCISHDQKESLGISRATVIHHGLDTSLYKVHEKKKRYLSFIGRIAPVKGVHIAIEVARKSGIPLKIAGEVQPLFQDYFDSQVKPHLDGDLIEYIGSADMAAKNELLGNSAAMLFPIQWEEPFGLVMIESMACGTPVLAYPSGSVPEIVKDGISGFVCADVDDMAARAQQLEREPMSAKSIRKYVEQNFSVGRMVDEYIDLYRQTTAVKNEQESAVA